MDGQPVVVLPTLNGADALLEKGRDLLPAVETIVLRNHARDGVF
jgi:hypothetical protein